jgi:hypothetical protein
VTEKSYKFKASAVPYIYKNSIVDLYKGGHIMKKNFKSLLAVLLAVAASGSVVSAADTSSTIKSRFFSDVNEDSYAWAIDYIDDIADRQIASGVGNGLFSPAATITRADFMVFVDKTFNLPQGSYISVNFSDVYGSEYYAQSAINAKASGIVTTDSLLPLISITRQDAMLYIYRALNKFGYVGNNASSDLSAFADASEVNGGETEIAIATLAKMGIVSGDNGNIKPKATMSRAEMAVVFSKVCSYMDNHKSSIETAKEQAKQEEQAKQDEELSNGNITGGSVSTAIEADGNDVNISNATVNIASQSTPALSVKNGTLTVNDTSIDSTGYSAVSVGSLGNALLNGVKATVSGSSALKVADGGSATVKSSTLTDNGEVVTKGVIQLTDGKVTLSDGTKVNGGESPAIGTTNGTKISVGRGVELNSDNTQGTVIVTTDGTGDNTETATISVTGATLTNNTTKGSLFYFKDANAVISLTESKLVSDIFLSTPSTVKTTQQKGSNITVNIDDQEVEGDIIVDSLTSVVLNIGKNGHYTGTVNAKGDSTAVDLYLDKDGELDITSLSCFNKFVVEDETLNNIKSHGAIVYYDANDSANEYLQGKTYDFVDGGQLIPY